jgi:hypothetical protein
MDWCSASLTDSDQLCRGILKFFKNAENRNKVTALSENVPAIFIRTGLLHTVKQ